MLGAIIGDMAGSKLEWHNIKNEKYLKLFMPGSHPTDDSVMTVAVARAMMDSYGYDPEDTGEVLISALHYFGTLYPHAGYGRAFSKWLSIGSRQPYNSWGNGSAMRVSPVGWIFDSLEETLWYAKISAAVTHDHPEGIKGAQAIAAAIYLARTAHSKDEIRKYIDKNFYALDFTLDEIRDSYQFDVSCQGSCPQAIEAFLEGESFEEVIIKALSIGGDSDTIAAMAGGIAEAYYGIPEWIAEKAFKLLEDKEDYGRVYNNGVIADEVIRFWNWLESRGKTSPRVYSLEKRRAALRAVNEELSRGNDAITGGKE